MIMTARYSKILLYILILAVMLTALPASACAESEAAPAPAYFDIDPSVEIPEEENKEFCVSI